MKSITQAWQAGTPKMERHNMLSVFERKIKCLSGLKKCLKVFEWATKVFEWARTMFEHNEKVLAG